MADIIAYMNDLYGEIRFFRADFQPGCTSLLFAYPHRSLGSEQASSSRSLDDQHQARPIVAGPGHHDSSFSSMDPS